MANQRPIRRGRFPRFRRGRRRPTKWLDANSSTVLDTNICWPDVISPQCEPTAPVVLISGDIDLDIFDSDVTFDRLVGNLNLTGYIASEATAESLWYRFGILAVEDTDGLYQTIDLWDRESVEEYEWMWIEERIVPRTGFFTAAGSALQLFDLSIPLDIKTRRKLGKKDAIVLYSQIKDFIGAGSAVISINQSHLMRAIAMSK